MADTVEPAKLARHLLPSGATPFERAHLTADIAAWPLDIAAIARQDDPLTCDPAWLPFLFFDKGGLVWSDGWTLAKKRQVTRDLFTYKRLEGTPAGVEAYLNLADALLIEEELPPGAAYLLPDETLDREAVLALMPQLRLYHDHPPRFEPWETAFWGGETFWSEASWTPETASPLGRYAVLWDAGTQTPLAANELSIDKKTATLRRRGEAGSASFWGEFAWGAASYFGDIVGHEPLVFDLADPGLVTTRDTGARVFEETFWGDGFWSATYWVPDDQSGRYERLYLWDPDRIPRGTSAYSAGAFWGAFRYGVPPHHSLLTVAIASDPPALPGAFLFWGEGYWLPQSHKRIAFAMQAAEAARRGGDRILITLSPTSAGGVSLPLPGLDRAPWETH